MGTKSDSYTKSLVEMKEANGDFDHQESVETCSLTQKHSSICSVDYSQEQKKSNRLICILALTTILLFIGIILLVVSHIQLKNCQDGSGTADEATAFRASDRCAYSPEAQRVGLGEFLDKVKESYYEVFPEDIAFHPITSPKLIKERFRVHDPRPGNIKRISDRADELLKECLALNPDVSILKPREHKAYLQVRHFLESTFANPYVNYNNGIWLLGPSSFCAELMCNLGFAIYNSVGPTRPNTLEDVDRIAGHLEDIQRSVYDYIDVLRMGIKKGMVRTRGECVAGLNAFKAHHLNISRNGPDGVRGEWYTERFYQPGFYQDLKEDLKRVFLKKKGINVTDFIANEIRERVGKSVHDLLTFLKTEHYEACRPDDVGSGGLSALPLDVIYSNGTVIPGSKTDPFLPNCTGTHCRLNGSNAYARILDYFTTKRVHPLQVYSMGWENVQRIYPQMIEIAKNLTNKSNESEAIRSFQGILRSFRTSYFHDEPLPENETNREAQIKCVSDETAAVHCPKRWEAMTKWFKFAQMVMSMHDPNTIDFFFFTGEHQSTPNCPIKLRAEYNPSSGAQSYDGSDVNCTVPCYYNIPFFLEHLGPKYSEYSVNAHEARPGHHTQVQGLMENFGDKCGGPASWLQEKTYYTAFTEGWALYGENPLIAQGTKVYETNLMQKYGMLKWQMWRALRLIVDTGLHYKGMSRERALKLFEKYAWDNTDLSKKEVTRYQSNYGQATAYMIGQLDIWSLRNHTEDKLRDLFSLKEFHLQTLSQGSSPLAFLKSHINKYINCKLDSSKQYCDIVLNPTLESTQQQQQQQQHEQQQHTSQTDFYYVIKRRPRRHHI